MRRWVSGLNHFSAKEATEVTRSGGSNPPRRVRAYMMTTYEYKVGFRHQLVLIRMVIHIK